MLVEPMGKWPPALRDRRILLMLSAVANTLFLAGFISNDLWFPLEDLTADFTGVLVV